MASLIKKASTWLYGQLDAHVSETVTLKRGAESNDSVTATRGRKTFEALDDFGHHLEVESVDWLIAASAYDLDDGNGPVLPAEGDQIEITEGGKTYTFEVMLPLPDEPPWVWADDYHTRLRVHTKERSVA